MKITYLSNIVNVAFKYVIDTSIKYNIDESHSLKHSMNVLQNANNIFKSESIHKPYLNEQKDIIYVSSIIHDMCDKKYMNELDGINEIKTHFKNFLPQDKINIISYIISTMSYSKVKSNGFPNLGEYQTAYHIVREADLLSSYDIDRCIIYGMKRENLNYLDAIDRAKTLFNDRVLNYIKDDLFITSYSRGESIDMHLRALINLKNIDSLKNNIL
jgi:hypothetical protein